MRTTWAIELSGHAKKRVYEKPHNSSARDNAVLRLIRKRAMANKPPCASIKSSNKMKPMQQTISTNHRHLQETVSSSIAYGNEIQSSAATRASEHQRHGGAQGKAKGERVFCYATIDLHHMVPQAYIYIYIETLMSKLSSLEPKQRLCPAHYIIKSTRAHVPVSLRTPHARVYILYIAMI